MGIIKHRGYSGGRGDDAHGVTGSPYAPEVTKSTGANTRRNETTGKNEVGIRREGPVSHRSAVSNKVYINLMNQDGGKTWVDEKSPAGKTQSKSDKSNAKALKKINKPKAMEKSRKAGQAYDAAKSAETRVNESWLDRGGMEYMGTDKEAADKATVQTFKTGGIKATQKRMKKEPSMADDAQDVRTKRIMDSYK